MKTVIGKALKLLFIFTLALSFASCKSSEDGGGTLPSGGGGGGGDDETSPVEDVPVGEVEQTGFWVNLVTKGQFDAYVKKRGQWDENCYIDKDTTGYEWIECIVDVQEGDLYMYEMELQYNAPPGLCDHVRTAPAWFYNRSIGTGPTNITIDINSAGASPFMTDCQVLVTPAVEAVFDTSMTPNDGTMDCGLHPELRFSGDGLDVTCIYDYSPDGPNCCAGSFTKIRNNDDGTTVTPSVESGDWGGEYGQCLGPHLSGGWDAFNSDGTPSRKVEVVPKDANDTTIGLNNSILLTANGASTTSYFSTWANWWEAPGAANGHTHTGFFDARVSNLPYAVDPIDDLSGTTIRSGNPAWTFDCLDSGFEVRQRISLYIREWNTLFEFLAYGNSEGLTYNPDVGGIAEDDEGVSCQYDPIFGDDCNDRWDFDDILENAGGAYLTNPGVQDNVDRFLYFPNISTD